MTKVSSARWGEELNIIEENGHETPKTRLQHHVRNLVERIGSVHISELHDLRCVRARDRRETCARDVSGDDLNLLESCRHVNRRAMRSTCDLGPNHMHIWNGSMHLQRVCIRGFRFMTKRTIPGSFFGIAKRAQAESNDPRFHQPFLTYASTCSTHCAQYLSGIR
jgi:hypothetical protein